MFGWHQRSIDRTKGIEMRKTYTDLSEKSDLNRALSDFVNKGWEATKPFGEWREGIV